MTGFMMFLEIIRGLSSIEKIIVMVNECDRYRLGMQVGG